MFLIYAGFYCTNCAWHFIWLFQTIKTHKITSWNSSRNVGSQKRIILKSMLLTWFLSNWKENFSQTRIAKPVGTIALRTFVKPSCQNKYFACSVCPGEGVKICSSQRYLLMCCNYENFHLINRSEKLFLITPYNSLWSWEIAWAIKIGGCCLDISPHPSEHMLSRLNVTWCW